jgi:carboxyl-terminal processing protease
MKLFRASIAASALLLVNAFALADPPAKPTGLTPAVKAEVLNRASDLILTRAYVPGIDFSKWPAYLATQKDAIDKAQTDDDFATAIQDALENFKITHIVIHTPKMVNSRMTNSTIGIGIRINLIPEGVLVVGLIDKAPAEAAGIEVGDIITAANGAKVTGPSQIQGDEGTSVKITVKKSDGKMKDYTIVRRKFSTTRPEELTWVDKETAVLKIYTFDLAYNRDRVEDLIKQAAPAKRLIVDLRGNGGGAVLNLEHFLGTLLPDDSVMGTFIDKSLVNKFVTETKGSATDLKAMADWSPEKIRIKQNKNATYKGEVAVLVDGGSGSAAEIAAAALRDTLNSPIAGTKSAGAVLVSMMRPLPDNWVLQIPVDDYVTSKGLRLEGAGVVPDTVVAKVPSIIKKGDVDPTWVAAVDLLKKQETAKSGSKGQ